MGDLCNTQISVSMAPLRVSNKTVFSIIKSPIDAGNYSDVLQLFLNYTPVT